MGYECVLAVPEEFRPRVAEEVTVGLSKLYDRLDPDTPHHISITTVPEGLFVCDYLSNKTLAALAFLGAIQWLLYLSPTVLVEDA